jgi:HD superfamily phosphohydrolase
METKEEDMAEWSLTLKQGSALTPEGFGRFDSKVRIPVSGSILLTKEVRAVIDTPVFQRLRGVRQLGPTMFVFPGANHTRFEHSLGVYALALRYLEKLMVQPHFRDQIKPTGKSLMLIALCSLLHDIGHYPYSHWIEEIDELPHGIRLPTHEQRAEAMLTSGVLKEVLENTWGVDGAEIAGLISNDSKNPLVNSFINSAIDIDKIDYLVRDSIHCGISYGHGIDTERLLDSLWADPETGALGVTEKGRSALISILSIRNIMFQEVYWHKTVRACESMFKRFFYEFVNAVTAENKQDGGQELSVILNYSDDEFIHSLSRWSVKCGNDSLRDLIRPFAFGGRELYKPAYIYFTHNSDEPAGAREFFQKLFKSSYRELAEKSRQLAELLNPYCPGIGPNDIILDKTPIKSEEESGPKEGFRVYNNRKGGYDKNPVAIGSLGKYLAESRQAYIFCHPRFYDTLRELSSGPEGTLQGILADLAK